MDVTYSKYSLNIKNEPVLIKSATLHYFRCPGEKVWKDRLQKLKAAGYNTIDLYFCCNFHSQKQGEYDFSGIKDIQTLLQIAQDLGLFVIARPGPFINAEVTAGGLPLWLLSDKDVIPRNRKDGDYIRSEKYMKFVEEWYDQIIPKLNKFDNIIAFQIENEYSTNMAEPEPMQELYALARKKGIKAPIFHNDAYCAGLYADIVDIYACDVYPYISPEQNWKEDTFCFDTLDHLENNIRMYKTDAPIFIAEMQGGWFDKWCGIGYEKMRKALGREHINIVTKTALSQGVTMFNHYMGCGGTSWDDMACDEVYSSYEFTAGIAESGIPQENYYEAKEINYFLDAFNLAQTEASENTIAVGNLENKENIYCKTRKDNINLCEWVFIRNLNKTTQSISALDFNFDLRAYEMKILPHNLPLKGCNVNFSSLSLMGKIENPNKESILVILDKNNSIKISDYDSFEINDAITHIENNNSTILTFSDIQNMNFKTASFKKDNKETEFIFINKQTADKTWILDNEFIFGADILWTKNKELGLCQTDEIKVYDLKKWKTIPVKNESLKQSFNIKSIRSATCAHEIDIPYDKANWQISEEKTDAFSNKIYNEFTWYKTTFEGEVNEFEICAKHCFAMYLNGKQIYEHNSYCYENLYETEEYLKIEPPKDLLQNKNELTLLVQNLGFDKGFSNDTNLPRGLISFKTAPEKNLTWKVKGGLTPADENWQDKDQLTDVQNKYMHYVEMEFDIDEENYSPLYLSFEEATFNRATIYLNGQKIGKYVKSLGPQNKFFLMDAFTQKNNKLSLVIWLKSLDNQRSHDFKFNKNNVKIQIKGFKTFKKVHI